MRAHKLSRNGAKLASVLLAISAAGAHPAGAALINSPANSVSRLLTVQPIIVCDNAGANCANSSGLTSYETMANVIYNQAGIGIAFAAPRFYDNSAYLAPQVDTTTNGLFDTAHNLLRLAGHQQATDPNTLNVFVVNNLVSVTTGANNAVTVNPGIHSYGYGLIGGNGAIIATKPDSLGRVAALDTLAHELGHNLGLAHSDSPVQPYNSVLNLMNTGSRTVATDPCQIGPYTCAASGSARDQLAAPQRATLASPPILTELGKLTAFHNPAGDVMFSNVIESLEFNDYTTTPVDKIKYRFTDPTVTFSSTTIPSTIGRVPVGTHVEVDVTPTPPLVRSGVDHYDFNVSYAGFLTDPTFIPPLAYSAEYDFGDGITSRAGFDITGSDPSGSGFAHSDSGAVFTFDPDAAGLPNGPSYLPLDIGAVSPLTGLPVTADIDNAFATPATVASVPVPFADLDGPAAAAVPEPASVLLLATLAGGVAATRRRHRRR